MKLKEILELQNSINEITISMRSVGSGVLNIGNEIKKLNQKREELLELAKLQEKIYERDKKIDKLLNDE